jgi:hypothetical protein
LAGKLICNAPRKFCSSWNIDLEIVAVGSEHPVLTRHLSWLRTLLTSKPSEADWLHDYIPP